MIDKSVSVASSGCHDRLHVELRWKRCSGFHNSKSSTFSASQSSLKVRPRPDGHLTCLRDYSRLALERCTTAQPSPCPSLEISWNLLKGQDCPRAVQRRSGAEGGIQNWTVENVDMKDENERGPSVCANLDYAGAQLRTLFACCGVLQIKSRGNLDHA